MGTHCWGGASVMHFSDAELRTSGITNAVHHPTPNTPHPTNAVRHQVSPWVAGNEESHVVWASAWT